jgi:signal transduction histidine kinase
MRHYPTGKLNLGAPLTLTFALLGVLILVGNSLLIWQFRISRQQTDRLAIVSSQMMAILRLQFALVAFHQRLDELVELRDAQTLAHRSDEMQGGLIEQLRETRTSLNQSKEDRELTTRFLPVLDSVEIGFPHQMEAIKSLATTGDWEAVHHRVALQLQPTEMEITSIARDIGTGYSAELSLARQNTTRLQNRMMVLIPLLALSTFLLASLLAWVIARRIISLRIEERLKERMRITRDLHDTFLQTIQGSKLFAQNALAKCSDLADMRQAIEKLAHWLDRATEEARSALNSLQAHQDDQNDLVEILREIILDARDQGSMKIALTISGNPVELSPEVQDHVGRIAREAITNARRHSRAHQVHVKLDCANAFALTIVDDGKGFDPPSVDALNGHYGLRTMRERAAHIGGRLTISSSPTSGTRIELVLPRHLLIAGKRSSNRVPAIQ